MNDTSLKDFVFFKILQLPSVSCYLLTLSEILYLFKCMQLKRMNSGLINRSNSKSNMRVSQSRQRLVHLREGFFRMNS